VGDPVTMHQEEGRTMLRRLREMMLLPGFLIPGPEWSGEC